MKKLFLGLFTMLICLNQMPKANAFTSTSMTCKEQLKQSLKVYTDEDDMDVPFSFGVGSIGTGVASLFIASPVGLLIAGGSSAIFYLATRIATPKLQNIRENKIIKLINQSQKYIADYEANFNETIKGIKVGKKLKSLHNKVKDIDPSITTLELAQMIVVANEDGSLCKVHRFNKIDDVIKDGNFIIVQD